jgi:hypothetical protein
MDSILKTFTIGFLLRSVFSGIFFVISYYVASHNPADFTNVDGKSILSVALPVALFGGVTAYGLHRSLVYPWIELWFDSGPGKKCRGSLPLISIATIETLLWRWNQGVDKTKFDSKGINEHFNTWADFIHLQYASTLCIALGAFLGAKANPGKHSPCGLLIVVGVVLFLAAHVSDWRLHSVFDYVRKEIRKNLGEAEAATGN